MSKNPAKPVPQALPGPVTKQSVPAAVPAASGKQGCTPSFLTGKTDELNEACELTPSQKKEEYVQPESEKESGGEG
jgi:hypothetical protein